MLNTIRSPQLMKQGLLLLVLSFLTFHAQAFTVELAVAPVHSCALQSSGDVTCWGYRHPAPAASDIVNAQNPLSWTVPNLGRNTSSIAAGGSVTCAVQRNGEVLCWGNNANGQLGNGSLVSSAVPTRVQGLNDVRSISVGGEYICAVRQTDTVACWGNNYYLVGGQSARIALTPEPVTGIVDVASISVSLQQICAVLKTGVVKCWGLAAYGQNSTVQDRLIPKLVEGLSDITSVSANLDHACALTRQKAVKCWGSNGRGQLGEQTSPGTDCPNCYPIAVDVPGARDVKQVQTGQFDTCVLFANGQIQCWGDNRFGVLGSGGGATDSSGRVFGVSTAKHLSMNYQHACAVVESGDVKCWGWNNEGQLGDPSAPRSCGGTPTCGLPTPVTVAGLGFALDADYVFAWAERTNPEYFSPSGHASHTQFGFRFRAYKNGTYLGVNELGEPHLYYLGPLSDSALFDLNSLEFWSAVAEP